MGKSNVAAKVHFTQPWIGWFKKRLWENIFLLALSHYFLVVYYLIQFKFHHTAHHTTPHHATPHHTTQFAQCFVQGRVGFARPFSPSFFIYIVCLWKSLLSFNGSRDAIIFWVETCCSNCECIPLRGDKSYS